MAIISVSRQVAAKGDEISELLAKKLNYTFITRKDIENRIVELGFPAEKMPKYDERKPGFFASLAKDRDEYLNYVQYAILEAAAKQNVIIVGTDPGITAENNGGTHMAFEDISVMRAIPRVLIYDAVDANQLAQAIPQLLDYDGVVYIRIPRKLYPDVYNNDYQFKLGKSDVIKEGTDLTIFASGIMTAEALKVLPILEENGINAELIALNTLKPLDEESIIKSVTKTNKAVVYENHSIIGGAYGAVAELLSAKKPTLLKAIGINDVFGQTGKYKELLEDYKLDAQNVAQEIIKFARNTK